MAAEIVEVTTYLVDCDECEDAAADGLTAERTRHLGRDVEFRASAEAIAQAHNARWHPAGTKEGGE